MKRRLLLCVFLSVCFQLAGQDGVFISRAVRPYVDFLEKQEQSPVDYILSLYDRYDVVILGERDHRDTTQYELIREIISDPRFIENVGVVMTETGSHNRTAWVNRIIGTNYADDGRLNAAILELLRNMSHGSVLDKTNSYSFLKYLSRTNRSLLPEKQIKLILLDVPFSWEGESGQSYGAYWGFYKENMPDREQIMGKNAVSALRELPRGKALIILNSPHSYQGYENRGNRDMAAQYIFEAFPDRVANVMINWCLLGRSDDEGRDRLIADGRWDAAFAVYDYRPLGFDLSNSPFGEDYFKDMIKPSHRIRYNDVYTGFIYYKPPQEWVSGMGIPGLISDDFRTEYLRRRSVISGKAVTRVGKWLSDPQFELIYPDHYRMQKQIRKHYRVKDN